MDFHVVFEVTARFELGLALLTLEGPLPRVDAQVSLQVAFFVEPLAANGAVEGFVFNILNKKTSYVCTKVDPQPTDVYVPFLAAFERAL